MENNDSTTISRLLQRMDATPGFAGLGSSIEVVSQLGEGDNSDTQQICATILRDAALTSKLLRIANSARNARAGRNITTLDQVLALLGLNTVKSVALSLALLGSLSHTPQSKLLHAEILAAYFCGSLAFEITRHKAPRFNPQEAQVCGLMQNLARMMATYFMYDDMEACRRLKIEENLGEEEAVRQVFGLGFDEMGAAILRHWGLPETLEHSVLPPVKNSKPNDSAQSWHQYCSSFCRRLTDALFRTPEDDEKQAVVECMEQYGFALNLKEDQVAAWIESCLRETGAIMAALSFPCSVEQARIELRKGYERVQDRISSGGSMTRESDSIDGKTPIELIQQVLRAIHARCEFDRSLLCMVDSSGGIKAIAGIGRNAAAVTSRFRCQGPKPDLFRAVVPRKQDVFIADVRQPAYARLLPGWYSECIDATSIMLMPLVHGDKLLGVVYGDYDERREWPPAELNQEGGPDWRGMLVQALLAGTIKTAQE